VPLSALDPSHVMSVANCVDAALAGLDRREAITMTSLEDESLFVAYDNARSTLFTSAQWVVLRLAIQSSLRSFAHHSTYGGIVAANIYQRALIVGAGLGISASVARLFSQHGMKVGLISRDGKKLKNLMGETKAALFPADATDPEAMRQAFEAFDQQLGVPDVVVYNASARAHGPVADIDPAAVKSAIDVTAFGAFLTVQLAARRMIPAGRGAILLTGASASIKGFPLSSAFAMGKFALRGLAQSAARELSPHGVHVAHFIIDGAVRSVARPDPSDRPDSTLSPEGIAQSYWNALQQPRDAWSHEIDLRPWVERF
jgi:NAD(P)-dependent dehydrogenase (short-subunit alcohol dehydrogenase family)